MHSTLEVEAEFQWHPLFGAIGHHPGRHIPLAHGHIARNEIEDAQGYQRRDNEAACTNRHRGLGTQTLVVRLETDPAAASAAMARLRSRSNCFCNCWADSNRSISRRRSTHS